MTSEFPFQPSIEAKGPRSARRNSWNRPTAISKRTRSHRSISSRVNIRERIWEASSAQIAVFCGILRAFVQFPRSPVSSGRSSWLWLPGSVPSCLASSSGLPRTAHGPTHIPAARTPAARTPAGSVVPSCPAGSLGFVPVSYQAVRFHPGSTSDLRSGFVGLSYRT